MLQLNDSGHCHLHAPEHSNNLQDLIIERWGTEDLHNIITTFRTYKNKFSVLVLSDLSAAYDANDSENLIDPYGLKLHAWPIPYAASISVIITEHNVYFSSNKDDTQLHISAEPVDFQSNISAVNDNTDYYSYYYPIPNAM